MGGYAWVTLATNNSYSLGALVLAHSLKKSNTAHKLVVLITSAVSESMRNQLNTVFDVVKLVDVLDSKDEAHLALMQRPELGITFTKIHCWRLIEFEKCVFLDADTLVVRNCDELFEREEFSAAPDASWPDCFNSGVFVFRPSIETFNKILQFAVENKSFDGGDQGLLNQFFSNWATEDIKKHLPFVYNLTSIGPYSYIPAFKHYGSETRIVHFIGTGKPWLQQLDVATKTVTPTSGYEHLGPLLQQWWDLFCEKVHPNLDKKLESSNEGMSNSPVEACSNSLSNALTDEPQTVKPCTPCREIFFMQHSPSFQPFKASSGESLNLGCFLASVVSEQRKPERSEMEGHKSGLRENVVKEKDSNVCKIHENTVCCSVTQETKRTKENNTEEEEKGQKAQEEPPPKDPYKYESFFPDETCIKNYLEQNVATYQPFDCRQETKITENPEPEQSIPSLPRFLTIPEDDRRQSGNNETPALPQTSPKESPPEDLSRKKIPEEKHEQPQREPTLQKEESTIEKRELTKSKSMPFLPFEVTATGLPPTPSPPRSIWKSQPNVNVDPNRKYSMPKLKPILPKQNSFSKSVSTSIPKVTHYTEFVMSSEYKDPIDLPKDRIGFIATHLSKESKQKRKSNVRSKFGPLPFIPSPEEEKPAKKIRLEHLDTDLYDLTQLKRQSGNRKKPKEVRKKETGNSLEEILKRLRDYSKDYQHYFGVIPKPRKKTVIYKNAFVQATGEGESRTSEPFKRVRTFAANWSRGTQTVNINKQEEGFDGLEFRLFRNYVNASQKGLLKIPGKTEKNKESSTENEILIKTPSVVAKETLGVEDNRVNDEVAFKEPKKSKENEILSVSEGDPKIKENKETQKTLISDILRTQKTSGKYEDPAVCREIKNEESQKLQNTNSKCSENEEETVKHSKSNSVEPENQQENPSDGAGTAQSNNVSLNVEKPSCANTNKDVKTVTPKEPNFENEEPLLHSRNHLDLVSEQNQSQSVSNDVSNSQSTGEAEDDSKNHLESFVNSSSVLEQNHEENQNGVTSSQISMNLEKSSSLDFCTKSSKIGTPHAENETKPVLNLKILSTPDHRETNNMTNTQSDGAPEDLNNSCVRSKGTHSGDQSQTFLHPNSVLQQNPNDVTALRNNGISLQLKKAPDLEISKDDFNTRSPKVQSSHLENEKSVLDPSSISVPVLEQNDQSNDLSKTLDKSYNLNDAEEPEKNGNEASVKNFQTSSDAVNVIITEDPKTQSTNDTKPVESNINNSTPVSAQKEDVKEFPQKASITSNPVIAPEQNGHKVKENFCISTNKPQQEDKIQKIVQEPKKPEEVLCVPDFETPRSSRVTLKTLETESEVEKPRKSRSSPKKVEVPSNVSPDEAVRFPLNKNSPPRTDERLEETKNFSGIAGAIAQLSLQAESEQTPESTAASAAHQEYLRRQNWETGNIDYMGRDSFDNIWSKICQTLESKAEQPSTTGEIKKPAVTPSSESPNVPEFIETLPGKPAPGPVEEDEIIFSKPDSRQSGLSNISEEEEVGKSVKLSDILKPVASGGGEANVKAENVQKGEGVKEAASGAKPELPVNSKAEIPTVQPEPVKTEIKPEPAPASTDVKTEPGILPMETKSQPPSVPPEMKLQVDSPPSVSSNKPGEEKPQEAQSQPLQQPEKKIEECKVVALPSPPILSPGPPPTDKILPKSEKPQEQPQVQTEPIPLPPPTPQDQKDPNQKV